MLGAIHQLAVNLIGDDREVMFLCQGSNIRQFVPAHYGTGGITRVTDKDGSGFTGNAFFNVFSRDFKVISFKGRDTYWFAFRQDDIATISNERRVGEHYFITRVKSGAHC